MADDAPVFVKLEEYDDVLSIVAVINKKLEESKERLIKIKQLNVEEEEEINAWEDNLKDVHEKMEFIGDILQKPRF